MHASPELLFALCSTAHEVAVALCSQRWRETSEEKRDIERLQQDMINDVRQAAEVHRQASACSRSCTLVHPCL